LPSKPLSDLTGPENVVRAIEYLRVAAHCLVPSLLRLLGQSVRVKSLGA
jgi:hypothetical protein